MLYVPSLYKTTGDKFFLQVVRVVWFQFNSSSLTELTNGWLLSLSLAAVFPRIPFLPLKQ